MHVSLGLKLTAIDLSHVEARLRMPGLARALGPCAESGNERGISL